MLVVVIPQIREKISRESLLVKKAFQSHSSKHLFFKAPEKLELAKDPGNNYQQDLVKYDAYKNIQNPIHGRV